MSLRTRLAMLAAFALIALLIALFVAWRLARATETFAIRQADASLHTASRDLARALQAHPRGYQTIEEITSSTRDPREGSRDEGPRGEGRRGRSRSQQAERLFAAYADPLARLTAITLSRYPETAGGYYRATDNALVGYASPSDARTSNNVEVATDLSGVIRTLASQAVETGTATSSTIQEGSDRIIIVASPTQADDIADEGPASRINDSSNGLAAAWAIQRLSNLSGVSEGANLAALIALALSIIAVSGLALTTVIDLRRGVISIEDGLAGMKTELERQIPPPRTPELARISVAINQLAAELRTNIERQRELEHDLRQSERLSALGRLVAGVAHEVRNPLASMKLKIQMARRWKNAPERLDDTFRVVTEEIDRLDALVRRLLELGRKPVLERKKFDLYGLAHRRAALLTALAERAGIEVVINEPHEKIEIDGDEDRLSQVIDNLMQNGLEAMPDGGKLIVTCETSSNQNGSSIVRLVIEDTGRGIAPEERDHIFEPFYTGRDEGTGLGLAIAREIIEAHGGRITFESQKGSGTRFIIELPCRTQA
ncbi:MAG TPA: ATP-binding protein [Pyrinomonadaceae bacterium]|nr:ATP-binding protein [Pyrinomonadaceae bacterium]